MHFFSCRNTLVWGFMNRIFFPIIAIVVSLYVFLPNLHALEQKTSGPFVCPMHERVEDKALFFTDGERKKIIQTVSQIDHDTTVEIRVYTIQNLEGKSVEEVALKTFNSCGIGKPVKNNGILLLFSRDDRKIRIEVGYGLEPIITNSLAGQILDTKIIPDFQKGNYAAGVSKGVSALKEHFYNNQVKRFFTMKWDVANFESFINDYSNSPLRCNALMFLGRFYEDLWEASFLKRGDDQQKSITNYQRYLTECPTGIRRKIVEHELSMVQKGKSDGITYLQMPIQPQDGVN